MENRFENIKRVLRNLDDLCVDLTDENIEFVISPNTDIRINAVGKGLDAAKNFFFIRINPDGHNIDVIKDVCSNVIDYMDTQGYKTVITQSIIRIPLQKAIDGINNSNYPIFLSFFKEDNVNESLPNKKSIDQLKMVRKLSKGIDIGDKISDMTKQGANISYIQNPIETGIESYEDFENKNKSFVPSWNLKHLKPFGK
jgi:hypothetical protein